MNDRIFGNLTTEELSAAVEDFREMLKGNPEAGYALVNGDILALLEELLMRRRQDELIIVQSRKQIHGWKHDPSNTFVSHSYDLNGPEWAERDFNRQAERIDQEDVESWQPHITRVIQETRQVTPWTVIRDTEDAE